MPSLRFLLLILLFCSPRLAGETHAWPSVKSDLPQDPDVKTGTLPNGLRYLVERTNEPKKALSLRLVVLAGARNESPTQEGAAHLVEHMAFRSSLDPGIEAVRRKLEHRGVASGPNLTAFTFFDHTVYNIDLPVGDSESMALALKLLRAYAEAVAFDGRELELERDIVLNEDALHKNQGSVVQSEINRIVWPQQSLFSRTVGGSDAAIRKLSVESCRAFYETWYRPANMAVIAVGDVPKTESLEAIEGAFSSMKERAPRVEFPNEKTSAADEPGSSRFTLLAIGNPRDIFIRFYRSWTDESPYRWDGERRLTDMKRQLALQMFNDRLYKKSNRPGSVFDHPTVELVTPVPGCNAILYSARCNPSDWSSAFSATEHELRRATLFGFFPDELEKARGNLRRSIRQAISYRPSIMAAAEADRLKSALVGGYEIVAPETRWEALKQDLDSISTEDCTRAFRELWGNEPPKAVVAVSGSLGLESSQLLDALRNAEKDELRPEAPEKPPILAYDAFGAPGRIVRETEVPDLGLRLGRFANGTLFNFKRTDFERNVTEVYLRFGHGRRSEPENRAALDLVASIALWEGGVGKHTAAELGLLLEAELLTLRFTVEDDAFCLFLRGPSESMEAGLKIVAAFLSDAAFRPSAMTAVRAALDAHYLRLSNTPMGPIASRMESLLASDDTRFGAGDLDDAKSRTMAEVANWLQPALREGPIELGVVGDIAYEDAVDLVARTMGALPPREERKAPDRKLEIVRAKPQIRPLVSSPGITQSAVSFVWFADDDMRAPSERRFSLVADIVSARVREGLRERMGAAYVTEAEVVNHEGFSNFSYLQVYVLVDTERVPEAIKSVAEEISRLGEGRLTADEFERIRQPFLASYDQSLRTNSYWGYRVLRMAQEFPVVLENARERSADVRSIDLDAVNRCIGTYMNLDSCHLFFTVPPSPR